MVKSSITIFAAVAAALLSVLSLIESAPFSYTTLTVREDDPKKTTIAFEAGNVCLMLPRVKGKGVAESEDDAIAYCQNPTSAAPGAELLPDGFILSANILEDKEHEWIQVTGRINRDSLHLEATDEGGQYDTKAPSGASCAGYESFVQITEPANNIYCLRCCKRKNKTDCPVNKSTDGCVEVLGGVYS